MTFLCKIRSCGEVHTFYLSVVCVCVVSMEMRTEQCLCCNWIDVQISLFCLHFKCFMCDNARMWSNVSSTGRTLVSFNHILNSV